MGTRGYVLIKVNGKIYAWYNHYDSYPSYLGKVLMELILKHLFGENVTSWEVGKNELLNALMENFNADDLFEGYITNRNCDIMIEYVYFIDTDTGVMSISGHDNKAIFTLNEVRIGSKWIEYLDKVLEDGITALDSCNYPRLLEPIQDSKEIIDFETLLDYESNKWPEYDHILLNMGDVSFQSIDLPEAAEWLQSMSVFMRAGSSIFESIQWYDEGFPVVMELFLQTAVGFGMNISIGTLINENEEETNLIERKKGIVYSVMSDSNEDKKVLLLSLPDTILNDAEACMKIIASLKGVPSACIILSSVRDIRLYYENTLSNVHSLWRCNLRGGRDAEGRQKTLLPGWRLLNKVLQTIWNYSKSRERFESKFSNYELISFLSLDFDNIVATVKRKDSDVISILKMMSDKDHFKNESGTLMSFLACNDEELKKHVPHLEWNEKITFIDKVDKNVESLKAKKKKKESGIYRLLGYGDTQSKYTTHINHIMKNPDSTVPFQKILSPRPIYICETSPVGICDLYNYDCSSISEALKFSKELIEIVQSCHKIKIFHGDISPKNIVLLSNGSLLLIDFEQGYKRTPCFHPQEEDSSLFVSSCHEAKTDLISVTMTTARFILGKIPFYNEAREYGYKTIAFKVYELLMENKIERKDYEFLIDFYKATIPSQYLPDEIKET